MHSSISDCCHVQAGAGSNGMSSLRVISGHASLSFVVHIVEPHAMFMIGASCAGITDLGNRARNRQDAGRGLSARIPETHSDAVEQRPSSRCANTPAACGWHGSSAARHPWRAGPRLLDSNTGIRCSQPVLRHASVSCAQQGTCTGDVWMLATKGRLQPPCSVCLVQHHVDVLNKIRRCGHHSQRHRLPLPARLFLSSLRRRWFLSPSPARRRLLTTCLPVPAADPGTSACVGTSGMQLSVSASPPLAQ